MVTAQAEEHILFAVNYNVGRVFFWSSIGLAVLTALLQGMVAALAFMTESSAQWTFRFRLALMEHWWWSVVSSLLLCSLLMISLSFVSGNGGDSISVLALSSATFLATVQYTLPAWQQRHYIRIRWLSWSGSSRTAIRREKQKFCRDNTDWQRLIRLHRKSLALLQATPSDKYGWSLWPVKGIAYDPTDILSRIDPNDPRFTDAEKGLQPRGVYHNADTSSNTVSLLWGRRQGFRRRISRAVASMPLCLLTSNPTTTDGYDGKGLTNAMGILGRNKGLRPSTLVFRHDPVVSSLMENASTWAPRPTKVLRSFYKTTLGTQYGGLGEDYVNSAVELALIMSDMPHWAIEKWLEEELEHQSFETNKTLAEDILLDCPPEERQAALTANYESSYASMILSLNYMDGRMVHRREARSLALARPDLICTGLLLKQRGNSKPSWWNKQKAIELRNTEMQALSREHDWKLAMAKLLGLDAWPNGFEESPSTW